MSTGGKGAVFALLKYMLLLALAVLLISQASGNRVSGADFGSVEQAVLAAADLTPMTEGDNQMLRRLYGLDPDSFQNVLLYVPSYTMSVEEILLVKYDSSASQDAVREAMEARVQSQIDVFSGYGPEQVAMLERAVIDVRGNYALLVVAEDPDAVRQAFAGAL